MLIKIILTTLVLLALVSCADTDCFEHELITCDGDRLKLRTPSEHGGMLSIIGYPSGGGTDAVMQAVRSELEIAFQHPVRATYIINESGKLATQLVYDNADTGKVVVFRDLKYIGNQYDLADWEMFPIWTGTPVIIVANDSPYKTMGDLIKAANSGIKIKFGTPGENSNGALVAKAFALLTNPDNVELVNTGGSAIMVEAISRGEVDALGTLSGAMGYAPGDLRILATWSNEPQRYKGVEIPPLSEYTDKEIVNLDLTMGAALPKSSPPEVIEKFTKAWDRLNVDELAQKRGYRSNLMSGDAANGLINNEYSVFKKITEHYDD